MILMQASRQESLLSSEDIPLSVKSLYYKLREYMDTSREGRAIARYRLDAILVGLKKIPPPPENIEPSYTILSKEFLIDGMGIGYYDNDKR